MFLEYSFSPYKSDPPYYTFKIDTRLIGKLIAIFSDIFSFFTTKTATTGRIFKNNFGVA